MSLVTMITVYGELNASLETTITTFYGPFTVRHLETKIAFNEHLMDNQQIHEK